MFLPNYKEKHFRGVYKSLTEDVFVTLLCTNAGTEKMCGLRQVAVSWRFKN
jgi:hypothetical protein